jgi:hypothetical protein
MLEAPAREPRPSDGAMLEIVVGRIPLTALRHTRQSTTSPTGFKLIGVLPTATAAGAINRSVRELKSNGVRNGGHGARVVHPPTVSLGVVAKRSLLASFLELSPESTSSQEPMHQ